MIQHHTDSPGIPLGPKYVAPCSVFRLTPDEAIYRLVAQALNDERTHLPEPPPEPVQLPLW